MHLDGNRIGYEGMSALANTQGLPALSELNIKYNQMDPQGLELLFESNKLNALPVFTYDSPSED